LYIVITGVWNYNKSRKRTEKTIRKGWMNMSEQTLNMLRKLSPKKEHSLAFRCLIGAVAIVLLTVFIHILVFTAIERISAGRDVPEWYRLLAGLSVDALYPLFIVSLMSIIKRVFRIPVHRLERKVFKFTYLCLGLIAASRISMYVGLYVFFMALFAAGTAIYIIIGIRFLYELFKYRFISCRYY
jgi:hypothetical protein